MVGYAAMILGVFLTSKARFIKEAIDKIIEEELRMSVSTAIRKFLDAWDVPPEERDIIARVMEGLNPDQRQIILAALGDVDSGQKLSPEQRARLARILKDPQKLERLLAQLEE